MQGQVDMAFWGHYHAVYVTNPVAALHRRPGNWRVQVYRRRVQQSAPRGVVHVTVGSAGAILDSADVLPSDINLFYNHNDFAIALVSASASTLTLRVVSTGDEQPRELFTFSLPARFSADSPSSDAHIRIGLAIAVSVAALVLLVVGGLLLRRGCHKPHKFEGLQAENIDTEPLHTDPEQPPTHSEADSSSSEDEDAGATRSYATFQSRPRPHGVTPRNRIRAVNANSDANGD